MSTQDNGMRADAYTPVGEVASARAANALDLLRTAGVAAYVVGDEATEERLTLWVDSAASARARTALGPQLHQGGSADAVAAVYPAVSVHRDEPSDDPHRRDTDDDGTDVDAAWAAIVAGYDVPADPGTPRWPALEDTADPDEQASGRADAYADPGAGETDDAGTDDAESGAAETGATDSLDPDLDHEGHYVPPPPPPLPKPDLVTRWAWAGGVALTGTELADWVLLTVVAAFIAGFVTLVARMKDHPTDSGGDDGAVV